ncbi:MAG: leucyl aminopeptidase [Proteobacteria bacterium]|nr:leucyl aminopeptidase [Pseudomonadota bacterium]
MKNTKLVVSTKKVEEYSGDLLVTLVALDEQGGYVGDDYFRPLLESLVQYKEFSGKKDEQIQLYPPFGPFFGKLKCRRLLLVGLGCLNAITDLNVKKELLRTAGGAIAAQCKSNKVTNVGICMPNYSGLPDITIGEFLSEGILLGDYRFLKYKTKKKDEDGYAGLTKIELLATTHVKAIRSGATKASNSAKAVITARDMANEPGNGLTPSHFSQYAIGLAESLPLRCTILEKKDMIDLGLGGIIAVNQGSDEPPKVVILEYSPKQKGETILLVGKGLTFDSGGVSLKPAQGMMDMKYDMCGGAAVLAAMEAVGREKPAVRVVAIVPATDNMAGGGALKPGDIITHYGGITSEIESTDAEGRLILADALAYGIEKFHPDCVIDLATLTGSAIFALGHHYCALLSNNDKLAEKLIAVGTACAEPLWRLPLGEMYVKQIKSQVADIKNTGGKPAGCITAAEYLHQFVGSTPWAHLDIAGTAWDFSEKTYIPKGPSGFGVRILIEFLRRWETCNFPTVD